MEIVRRLKKGDGKHRACIDYKIHALIYENSSNLLKNIEENVVDKEKRTDLKSKLEVLKQFLKYRYEMHIDSDDASPESICIS